MKLGVIADDFTGGTDIASFLVANGMRTVQLNGPQGTAALPLVEDFDAAVISLKSRSIPSSEAVSQSLQALRWLRRAGARQFYFKYCSTFDSTEAGNIGPVTDALMVELGQDFTVVCPALPVNHRTVYLGHLFVGEELLHESGMRNHPVTPMLDSNIIRLMEAQSSGRAQSLSVPTIDDGSAAVEIELTRMRAAGVQYAVLDAIHEAHLESLGQAVKRMPLVTGGSGLGGALARALYHETPRQEDSARRIPLAGRTVVLSGSSSRMTNQQVSKYMRDAPAHSLDIDALMASPSVYVEETAEWVLEQSADGPAPMVFASADPATVAGVQHRFGAEEAGQAIEEFFGSLAMKLRDRGISQFIVAGGETSGAVTTALRVEGFIIGPQVAPGVPWVRSLDGKLAFVLKSGNFGESDFFGLAQAIARDS